MKSVGLYHVHMFLKITLQENILYIHLMQVPPLCRSYREQNTTVVIFATGANVSS